MSKQTVASLAAEVEELRAQLLTTQQWIKDVLLPEVKQLRAAAPAPAPKRAPISYPRLVGKAFQRRGDVRWYQKEELAYGRAHYVTVAAPGAVAASPADDYEDLI